MERILVSACLLGIGCRYDGKEKGNAKVIRLAQQEGIQLVPVCPEQFGGLPIPRVPSERCGDLVKNRDGIDVTAQYEKGAREAWKMAQIFDCKYAILKEKSPSCGSGEVYDGTFSKNLIPGDGVTTEYLKARGVKVYGESQLEALLQELI